MTTSDGPRASIWKITSFELAKNSTWVSAYLYKLFCKVRFIEISTLNFHKKDIDGSVLQKLTCIKEFCKKAKHSKVIISNFVVKKVLRMSKIKI